MKKNSINTIAYSKSVLSITISMNTPGCQSDNSQLVTELLPLGRIIDCMQGNRKAN